MADAFHTVTWRALPVWMVAVALLLYGADEPLASLVLFWPAALLGLVLVLRGRPAPTAWELAAGFCLAAAALLHVLTQRWPSAAPEMAALCLSAGLLFAVPRLARTRRAITRLIDLILILAGLIGLAAFLDFVIDPSTQWGRPRPFHAGRLSAPFLSANTAATFYGAILIFAGARLLEAMRRDVPASSNSDRFGERARSLLVPVSVLLVCGTDLFLSASRAGISLAMTGLLALLVWDSLSHWRGRPGEKSARQAWVPTVFVGLSGLVFLMSGTLYASRLEAGLLDLADRTSAYAAYWDALRLQPLFGDGLGSFAFTNDVIATAEQAAVLQDQGAAHNVLLQWGLQTGLVGTTVMLTFFAAMMEGMRRGLSRRRRQCTQLRAVLVVALFMAGHGMVDYALEIPAMSALLAVWLGLGRAILWRPRGG
ncbi:O-antigen ligase family protein [Maricaulis alexandrii]|uniref:O-antigen ligase family protein n=1 Tax=Maricaulis alexandrii TaxID=2570354 RepID=UPI0011090A8C|nr:O-antigen ligase family protein [Maricaulis alexandrii]